MVDTTASLDLQGKGNLPKYLEDLNKQFADLNKVTETQTKGFSDLNKVGNETGDFVTKTLGQIKKFAEVTGQINKGGKDTIEFLKNAGSATIELDTNLGKATKGVSGFVLGFTGLKDEAERVDSAISPLANNFRDIANAQTPLTKAFVILDKTSKPIVGTLNRVSDGLESLQGVFNESENFVASFGKTVINSGAKSLEFFSDVFTNVSDNLQKSGFVGRLLSGSFDGVASAFDQSAEKALLLSASLDPNSLTKVDAVGKTLAGTLGTVSGGFEKLATGVKFADLAGDIYLAANATKEFVGGVTSMVVATASLTASTIQASKASYDFITDTGEAVITLDDSLDSASRGFSGLGLRYLGLKDDADALNKVISKPAGHFRDIAEAQGLTAKAFVILDKTSKPIVNTLNILSNQLEKFEGVLQDSEVYVANFAETLTGVGSQSLLFFSNTFKKIGEDLKSSSLFGKVFAKSFDSVSESLANSAQSVQDFGKQLNPEDLKKVDIAGERLAGTFDGIGKAVDRLSVGVKIADFAGDVSRAALGIRDSATEIGTTAADSVKTFGNSAKYAIPLYFGLNTRFQIAAQSAGLLAKVTGNQLLSALSGIASKLGNVSIAAGSFVALTNGAADAYVQAQGLTDTFDVMQRMGIDTTAASIAFQFGIVGEKLLFSAEAAKEFGKTAIVAFSRLEDAAAFVTTIGAGASVQFEGLEAGVESISAAMTDLVGGPLKNAISSTEAADALYNALSAGIGVAADGTANLAETNQFLSASLKLAAGSGANAAQTLELLAKTSKVYSLSNAEAGKTAAKLYQIVEQGITTFPQLTGGLGRTLSVAKATGVELEEAAGSVAALTKIMSTDDALQGFASLLQSVAGQGAQAQKAVQELGVRFDINSIKTKGLVASLKDLYEATGGNASAIKEIIPDALAYQTALNLMTSASEDAAETTQKVANAGEDALENLFEARQQSTIQQFSQVMNGFNEVLVDFGRRALPAIQPGVDFLNTLLDLLQGLPDPIKNLIGALVLAQTAISNIGGGLIAFSLTLGQVVAGLVAFRLFSKLMGNQLKEEMKIIGALNSEGVNFAATLLRLVGLNEKLDLETAQTNATLAQQKNLLRSFKKANIDFSGDISNIKDLQEALKETKNSIEKLKQSGQEQSNERAYRTQLDALERLEKGIERVVNKTQNTRSDIFSNLQKIIDKALSNVELDINERRKAVQKSLNNYLATFGDFGKTAQGEIDIIFSSIISNEALKNVDKVDAINAKFSELGQNVSPQVKKHLEKIRVELIEATQRLDGEFTGELSKVKTQISSFFSNLIPEDIPTKIKSLLNEVERDITINLSNIGQNSKELKTEIENTFKNLLGDADLETKEKINKINLYFDSLIDEAIPENKADLIELRSNLGIALAQMESDTQESVSKINNNLKKVGDGSGEIKRNFTGALGSIGDLVSNYIPQVGEFTNQFRDVSEVFENLGVKLPKVESGFKKVGAGAAKSSKGLGLMAAKKSIVSGIGTAASAAGTGFTFLSGAITTTVATLAPFIGIAAIAAASVAAILSVVGKLNPALGSLWDGNIRATESLKIFADELESTNKQLDGFNKDLTKKKEFLVETDITKNRLQELISLRKEVLASIEVEEKAYVQGIRGFLLNVFEGLQQFGTSSVTFLKKQFLRLGFALTSWMPSARKKFRDFFFAIDKEAKDNERNIRDQINKYRENVQAGIRSDQLQQIQRIQGALSVQSQIQESIIGDYQKGLAVTAEGTRILGNTVNEQRSLTAKELQKLQAVERENFKELKDQNNAQIQFLQDKLDATKDPVLQKAYTEEIAKINERNTSLEESIKLSETYRNRIQAILKVVEQNQAGDGLDKLTGQFNNLYQDLGPEARAKFLEFFGGELEFNPEIDVSDALSNLQDDIEDQTNRDGLFASTGAAIESGLSGWTEGVTNKIDVDFEAVGLSVQTAAERLRVGALGSAQASLQQSIEDINNPEKEVSQDTLATNLFNTLDAIGEAYPKEADKLEAIINAANQNINIGGVEAQLKDVLKPKDLESLSQQIVDLTGKTNDRVIAETKASIEQISALERGRKITSLESLQEIADQEAKVNELTLQSKREQLAALEAAEMGHTSLAKDLALEISTLEINADTQAFENKKKILDEELRLLQQKKDNELKIIEQGFEKEIALNELRNKSLSLEQSALNAQQELASAISNLQVTGLQNRLKFIGDIEEKAQAELEIAQARLSTLGVEQEFERQNLELQQELNKLSLEREKSTLRNTEAQLQNNLAIAQAKLAQAEQLNLTEEETTALNLQVSSIQQQLSINGQQQTQLEKQGQIQEEINQKQEQSLKLKQQAAQETSAAEVELAELEKVLAGYEKQKQVIANNAKEQSMAAEGRKLALDKQTAILDQQTQILEKQFEIVKQTSDLTSSYFDLAKQQATNSFRQRRLEREAAKVRRDNMEQIQKLEQSNLAIQQQQRDIALQRKVIELDIAKIEKESQLAQAEADFAAVQADPRATAEQRRASQLNVVAQQRGLEGIQQQQELLGIERSFNQFINQQERVQQRQQQQFDLLQADSAVAETTLSRGDDARISRRAQQQARENNEQLNSLVGTFTETAADFSQNVNAFTSVGTIATSGRPGGALVSTANNISPTSTGTRQPVSVNGQVSVTVDIKGNTDGVNKTELQKSISDGFYRSMNELLDYSIRRQS
jgi:TP901 family phage tail tape measure protein